jgi:hypothetical protein
VAAGDAVTLDGSTSSDPEAGALSYAWAAVSGPAVTLAGASTATATFTAPSVASPGEDLVFELTVTDGAGLTHSRTVTVHVAPRSNLAPVARPGDDQSVMTGDAVTLDGSTSSDPEAGALSYAWAAVSGPGVTLAGASTAAATFTAPGVAAPGADLVFELTVTDGAGLSDSKTVTVHVAPRSNRPPVANAGPPQAAVPGDVVVLDGSRSSDPDADTITYSWAQTSGTAATLSNATSATAQATMPALPAGAEGLVFALTVTDSSGLSSTASVTVSLAPTPAGPLATTVGLIDDAVSGGTLTAEKGLTYKVFALFGDPRLPAQYRGSEPDLVGGTGIMAELAATYDSLSVEAKTEVYPFLLPAYVTNSWYDLARRAGRLGRVGQVGRVGKVSRTAAAPGAPVWKWVTNGKVKVWYDEDLSVNYADGTSAKFADLAQGVLDAVGGTIWGKLTDLMGKEPPPDAGVAPPALPSADYGYKPGNLDASGALDIVLAHGMNASGYTHPYEAAPTPTFITIDAVMWPLGDEKTPGLIQIAAHELMHSWQFSYKKKEDPLSYYWVMEATAAWTEDYVYPEANSENRYAAWYLDTTRLPADDQTNFRQYGLYTAFSFWTNGDHGGGAKAPPSMVKTLWENAETMSSLDAVDGAYPVPDLGYTWPKWMSSFFERFWADALVAAWNRGEQGYFFTKDKLAIGAKVAPNKSTVVTLGGSSDKAYFLDDLDSTGKIELPYLTGRYYHFVFPEDAARTVMFYDGLRTKLELLVGEKDTLVYGGEPIIPTGDPPIDPADGTEWRLLTKIDGQWNEWTPPWHMPGASLYFGMPAAVYFCRDAKAERLQELVVILVNSSPDKDRVVKPLETASLLLVSNMGCWGWDGQITADDAPVGGHQTVTTAQVKYRRAQDVDGTIPAGVLPPGPFLLATGNFHTEISGQVDDCTYSGGDTWTDSSMGDANATLGMMPEARDGGYYRKFEGDGSSGAHEVPYHYQCKDVSGDSTTKPIWWQPSPNGVLADVSPDGTVLQGSLKDGDTHYQWNLHSVREP